MKGWYGDKLKHGMASRGIRLNAKGHDMFDGTKMITFNPTLTHLLGYLDEEAFVDALDNADPQIVYALALAQDDKYGTNYREKIEAVLKYTPHQLPHIVDINDPSMIWMFGYLPPSAYASMIVNHRQYDMDIINYIVNQQEKKYGGVKEFVDDEVEVMKEKRARYDEEYARLMRQDYEERERQKMEDVDGSWDY